jgi:drug/metabolite transporter (DMT)-like permease
MTALVGFVLFWCLCAGVGDVCYKRWSVAGSLWLLVIGSVFYMADTFAWAAALRRGLPIGRGSILMCMLSMLTGVAIGKLYGERMSALNWLGVAFALAAILCLPAD